MSEAAVRQLIAGRSNALRMRDVDGFLASYADDALIFDLAPPLVHGVDREGVAAWMRTWDGSIENDVELHLVKVSGAMAYAAGLERLAGTQGDTRDIWFCFTLCFAHTSDGWRITHEHTSLPVRKLAGQLITATDLSP
jgi:ketosteroid isomerase-like protein